MIQYKKGQRVKVEFEGTIIDPCSHQDCLEIKTDQGYYHYAYVAKAAGEDSGAKITLADPPDWPPQVGDIWEPTSGTFKGYEFFIRRNRACEYIITPQDGGSSWDLDKLKSCNPVLVRRRGQ